MCWCYLFQFHYYTSRPPLVFHLNFGEGQGNTPQHSSCGSRRPSFWFAPQPQPYSSFNPKSTFKRIFCCAGTICLLIFDKLQLLFRASFFDFLPCCFVVVVVCFYFPGGQRFAPRHSRYLRCQHIHTTLIKKYSSNFHKFPSNFSFPNTFHFFNHWNRTLKNLIYFLSLKLPKQFMKPSGGTQRPAKMG